MGGIHQPAGSGKLTQVGAVVFGADAEISQWVARQIPGYAVGPGSRALGVIKRDQLVAGVVFERYNGVHVEVAIAAVTGSRWADRRTLFALFDYPFNQLGCEAITVLVSSTNLESLNLAMKLGFQPQAYVPFAAPDGSTLIVLQMFRSACGWIGNEQKGQQSAGGP